MTRAEYEKFRNVARTGAMGEDYAFREYASQHPRVWLNREGRPSAWIDIFIFDSISGVPWMRKLKLLGCAFFLAFTKNRESMEVSRKANLHHGAKRFLLNVGYAMGRLFSARFKARMMNVFCKHAFSGNGKWIHRSNTMYSELGLILPAGVMGEYLRAPFEDAELMIVKRWHEVLVSSYGENYMPPFDTPPTTTRSTRDFAGKTEKTQPENQSPAAFGSIKKKIRLLMCESGGFCKPRALRLRRNGLFAIIRAARKMRIFAKGR